MKSITAAIKLCRPINLAIIVYAQIIIRFYILRPLMTLYELNMQVPEISFWLFVISTVFIAAGAYTINDYFDYNIDAVNKPKKLIVRKILSENWVNNQFIWLYAIGLIAAILGSYKAEKIEFTFIFGTLAILGYYYASELKSKLIVSNLVVAFMLGMVIFSIGIIEITMLNFGYAEALYKYKESIPFFQSAIKNALAWVAAFSLFAFLINIPREIIKDIVDEDGDSSYRVRSIPTVFGAKIAKIVAGILFLTTAIVLVWLQQLFLTDTYSEMYLLALAILIFAIGIASFFASSQKHFKWISALTKLAIFIGISYGVLARYIMENVIW